MKVADESRRIAAIAIAQRLGEQLLSSIEHSIKEAAERGEMRTSVVINNNHALDVTHVLQWYGYSTAYLGKNSDDRCMLIIEWGST